MNAPDEINDAPQDRPEATFGARLSQARQASGYTLRGLAPQVGMSMQQLNRYERGHTAPGSEQLRRLCVFLRVSPSWLIFGTEAPFGDSDRLGGIGDEQRASRVAMLFTLLGVDDRRALEQLTVRLVEAAHGREIVDQALAAADAMQSAMEPGTNLRERIEQTADLFANDSDASPDDKT